MTRQGLCQDETEVQRLVEAEEMEAVKAREAGESKFEEQAKGKW
jgi:hypothetical protein